MNNNKIIYLLSNDSILYTEQSFMKIINLQKVSRIYLDNISNDEWQ